MKVSDLLESNQLLTERVATPEEVIDVLGQEVVIDYIKKDPERLLGGNKNEQQGRVQKIQRNWPVRLIRQGEYESEMRKQPGQEEFTAKKSYGQWQDNGLIDKDGRLMVECISLGKAETTWLLDGQPIAKEDIVGLPAPRPPSEGQIPVRRIYVDCIQNIRPR